jgi:predicted amidophosphoribosyltransferase
MSLLDIVIPVDCIGCGAPGSLACPRCARSLSGRAALTWPSPAPAGLPPPWSVAEYDGASRALLLGYKENGAVGLAGVLAGALATSLVAAAAGRRVIVVPVPSAPRAVRERGADVVLLLTRRAASIARAQGADCRVLRALRHARQVADSAGLTAADRAVNLSGAFAVRRSALPALRAAEVVIADDLLTTGASLAEAARALRAATAHVVAGATVAATRRRDSVEIVGRTSPRATVRRTDQS